MVVLEWRRESDVLSARLASEALVREHSGVLAGWYNDPHNRDLMANTQELSAADVEEVYQGMRDDGGWPFLLFRNGELMGDADLRGVIAKDRAEFAIMIGARTLQGLGLGTAFSVMVHRYAFDGLGLSRVYLSIVAHNHGARRCYDKVGYVVDESELGRSYAEDGTDIAMRLDREAFFKRW